MVPRIISMETTWQSLTGTSISEISRSVRQILASCESNCSCIESTHSRSLGWYCSLPASMGQLLSLISRFPLDSLTSSVSSSFPRSHQYLLDSHWWLINTLSFSTFHSYHSYLHLTNFSRFSLVIISYSFPPSWVLLCRYPDASVYDVNCLATWSHLVLTAMYYS